MGTIPCALLKLNDQNYAMSCVARSAPVRRSTRQTRCFSRREGEGHGRRSALLHSASLLTVAPAPLVLAASTADAVPQFGVVADDVNAIEFAYPTTNAEGNSITWFVARRSVSYNSAPNLSPDGRAKIVFEQLSLADSLAISVCVSPVRGARYVREKEQSEWTAREVANAVLTDRSVGRIATGERFNLENIDASAIVDEGGMRYYMYESSRVGAPRTPRPKGGDEVTHAVSATAVRDGFFFSLKFSVPEDAWQAGASDLAKAAVGSFRLVPITQQYRRPDWATVPFDPSLN